MMALSLNKNARLQQENHFLSLQQIAISPIRIVSSTPIIPK